jgi:hypothetical protein
LRVRGRARYHRRHGERAYRQQMSKSKGHSGSIPGFHAAIHSAPLVRWTEQSKV